MLKIKIILLCIHTCQNTDGSMYPLFCGSKDWYKERMNTSRCFIDSPVVILWRLPRDFFFSLGGTASPVLCRDLRFAFFSLLFCSYMVHNLKFKFSTTVLSLPFLVYFLLSVMLCSVEWLVFLVIWKNAPWLQSVHHSQLLFSLSPHLVAVYPLLSFLLKWV